MSMNKAIEHGKEHRRPYRTPKSMAKTAGTTANARTAKTTGCTTQSKPTCIQGKTLTTRGMRMMRFRDYRGSFCDAMQTLRIFSTYEEFVSYLWQHPFVRDCKKVFDGEDEKIISLMEDI